MRVPRAIVTPELAETLRSVRLNNKIQVKKLAEHINKSSAFISKLESGNIQTIDTEDLYKILQYICNESNAAELANHIYQSLKIKYSAKEIEEQLWFVNFETVECLLPLPADLIDQLNARIKSLGISRQYLCSRINANEALTQEEVNDDSIVPNQWYHQKYAEGNAQSIKISMSEEHLCALLDKKHDIAPYVFIFVIMFYLLKIEKYGEIVSLSIEENTNLMEQATKELNHHKFYSISEKNRLLSERQTTEEVQDLLTSFDHDNIEIIGEILSGFQFASNHNIKTTNEQLKQFDQNMRWDLGFMLRVISLEFTLLAKTSVSNRKNLLQEINSLIIKYSNLPEAQNRIEEY